MEEEEGAEILLEKDVEPAKLPMYLLLLSPFAYHAAEDSESDL